MADSYYSKPQREEYFLDSGYYKFYEAYHLLKFSNEKQILEKAVSYTHLILGMGIALLLNQKVKCRGLFRSIAFMPWAVSGVLATMLWTIMYNQHVGVINDILEKVGILKDGVAWLSNPHTAFWAVVVSELWRGIPFFAITILEGLQSISQDIYESCNICLLYTSRCV